MFHRQKGKWCSFLFFLKDYKYSSSFFCSLQYDNPNQFSEEELKMLKYRSEQAFGPNPTPQKVNQVMYTKLLTSGFNRVAANNELTNFWSAYIGYHLSGASRPFNKEEMQKDVNLGRMLNTVSYIMRYNYYKSVVNFIENDVNNNNGKNVELKDGLYVLKSQAGSKGSTTLANTIGDFDFNGPLVVPVIASAREYDYQEMTISNTDLADVVDKVAKKFHFRKFICFAY
jgi:hypothetical protein